MQNTVAFYYRDIRDKFGIPNSTQSPDIGPDPDGDISDFLISGHFLINENCHFSRKSYSIDMKLGPVPKIDKRNTATSIDDDILSENCDVIIIYSIYGQFGAIRKPDFGNMVCKTYIFINSSILSHKNWKHN